MFTPLALVACVLLAAVTAFAFKAVIDTLFGTHSAIPHEPPGRPLNLHEQREWAVAVAALRKETP